MFTKLLSPDSLFTSVKLCVELLLTHTAVSYFWHHVEQTGTSLQQLGDLSFSRLVMVVVLLYYVVIRGSEECRKTKKSIQDRARKPTCDR